MEINDLSKFIISFDDLIPSWLEEPLSWRKSKWKKVAIKIIKGNKKWNEKNRFKVSFLTEKLPHNQFTNIFPK